MKQVEHRETLVMGRGGGGDGRGLDEGEENIPGENVEEEEVVVVVLVERRRRTSPSLLHLTRPFPGMERVQAH